MKKTLGELLRRFTLNDKDVAVVGPNCNVSDDPSLLYFANRMTRQNGSLTVLDKEPHHFDESHGDIYCHMEDLEAMAAKGMHLKMPEVKIGDILKTRLKDRFDIIYEVNTFKCIVNYEAARSRSKKYTGPAGKVLDAYHKMLKKGGDAVFVYADVFHEVGYSVLLDLLSDDDRFRHRPLGEFIDRYQMRNLNKEKVKRLGRRLLPEFDNSSKTISLDRDGYVSMGSGYGRMRVIVAKKE